MPLYEITTKGAEAKRLVDASSAAAAIRFCAIGMFEARTIQKPSDIAKMMSAGIALEAASDATPEPEAKVEEGDELQGDGTGEALPPVSDEEQTAEATKPKGRAAK